MNKPMKFTPSSLARLDQLYWQTQGRGSNCEEYQIYLACADDGNGFDITNPGQPLKTYEEWLDS